jgi:hypothetical protein
VPLAAAGRWRHWVLVERLFSVLSNLPEHRIPINNVTSLSYLGIVRLLVLMFRLYLYYRTYLGLSRYLDP